MAKPRLYNGRFAPKNIKKVLVLKVVNPDMSSQHSPGFKYPTSGHVRANDWKNDGQCGHGLHGWLYGKGNPTAKWNGISPCSKWLVIEVNESDIVDINSQKVKFREGNVVYCGDRKGAFEYIVEKSDQTPDVINVTKVTSDVAIISKKSNTTAIGKYNHIVISSIEGSEIDLGHRGVGIAHSSDENSVSVKDNGVAIAYSERTPLKAGKGSILIWNIIEGLFTYKVTDKTIKANVFYVLKFVNGKFTPKEVENQ